MPVVYCSANCSTNLGNFPIIPFGSISCQNCFNNGAYVRNLGVIYNMVDKASHNDLIERQQAKSKQVQDALKLEIRTLKGSLSNKLSFNLQELDEINKLLSSKTLLDYTNQFVGFIASIKQNKLNIVQRLETSARTIIQQVEVQAMTIIAREVEAISSDIKVRAECNDIDISKMETLREDVKAIVSEPNKAIADEQGEKLISGEKLKELQNFFDLLIHQRLQRKTLLSGLLKQGQKIACTQIKRYPKQEVRGLEKSK